MLVSVELTWFWRGHCPPPTHDWFFNSGPPISCDQGKREEARDLLAPVYNWFTEGFDTLYLQEAKSLLEELHA